MRTSAVVAATLLAWSASSVCLAGTWAEKLGYPPGKRVLILHAADLGAAYEIDRPAEQLLLDKLVQSADVTVPGQWFDAFAQWYRSHPGCDVGVSLSLNSPSELYRWRPLTDRHDVPSLVDADGCFWHDLVQVALSDNTKEVEKELCAQIERARAAGIRPTHIVTRSGALLTRPDLAEVYFRIARKYWLPAVIIDLTPAAAERLRGEGFPVSNELIDLVKKYPLPKLDDLRFVPDADTYEDKREGFFKLVRGLPPGLTQIVLHPADRSEAMELISPRWKNRLWESQLLRDPEVQQFLKNEGVVPTSWSEIMRRFDYESDAKESAEAEVRE